MDQNNDGKLNLDEIKSGYKAIFGAKMSEE